MKLSRVFSLDLLYDKAWKKYAAKAGIEDPWVRAREKQNEIKGEELEISTPNSKVKVLVVPTNEELMIARDCIRVGKLELE